MDVLMRWGSSVVAVLIGWVLTMALHRQQVAWERHLFGIALGKTRKRVMWVLGTGILLSLVPSLLWLWVEPLSPVLLWLWAGLTLGLAFLNARFAQPLRVLFLLYVLSGALQFTSVPSWLSWPWLASLRAELSVMTTVSMRGWWAAASSVFLIQGLAYWMFPSFLYSPYLGRTHRGGTEAGYRLTSWLTLLNIIPGAHVLTMVPLFIPWQDMYPGRLPQAIARKKGTVYILFGLAILVVIMLATFWRLGHVVYSPLVTLLMLLFAEGGRTIADRMLVQGPRMLLPAQEGLKILAVVPDSPAARIGFVPGEIVTEVNGKKVHTLTEYYRALQESPAFTRFRGLDRTLEMIMRQGPRYEGDHHLYGLIFVPHQSDVTWDRHDRFFQSPHKLGKVERVPLPSHVNNNKKKHDQNAPSVEKNERPVQG